MVPTPRSVFYQNKCGIVAVMYSLIWRSWREFRIRGHSAAVLRLAHSYAQCWAVLLLLPVDWRGRLVRRRSDQGPVRVCKKKKMNHLGKSFTNTT